MIVALKGEVRGVQPWESKDKKNKFFSLSIETQTKNLPELVKVNCSKNSRKVGEKVELFVRVEAQKAKNGNAELSIWEVN